MSDRLGNIERSTVWLAVRGADFKVAWTRADADWLQRGGWTVEGPFVRADTDQGAVDLLRELADEAAKAVPKEADND